MALENFTPTVFKYAPVWSQLVNDGGVENQLILFANNYAATIQIPMPSIYLITISMYADKQAIPPYLMDPLGLPVTLLMVQMKKTVADVNTVLDQIKLLTSLF